MVCLGPRRKEKKSTDAAARSLNKTSSKLKNSKTSASLSPSVASTNLKKNTSRLSLESTTKKTNANLPRQSSRNSLLPNERTPSPVHRSTSPHRPPGSSRANSVMSVKSNFTTTSATSTRPTTASRTPSHASNASKKHPISEMKEEVKDLKAKNEENLKLIADQKAELERLKHQISQSSPIVEKSEEALNMLKDKEEQLLLREREIEELRQKLDQQASSPTLDFQFESSKADILAQKEKFLEEKEAQLEEQKRMMDEKVPQIEKVAKQLETLKIENLDAVNQLASKEKELEELRAMINNKPNKEQKQIDKHAALAKIEELNKQLESQKRSHEEILRLHEQALAEKDSLLKEQQSALDSLQQSHQDELQKLKTAQANSIMELKRKHQQDKIDLENQLEEAREEANKNPAAEMENQLERILHEFEQAEHTHAVQIQDLEQSHQSELNNLANNQKAQLNKLKLTQDLNRDKWSSRYLPTDAVSWPSPNSPTMPKLRSTPSPLLESKSKTLLRVLGNMPSNKKPEPILTPLDPTKVQIYYSSVSTNPMIKRNQENIQQMLTSKNIKFGLVDVASSEAARQYAKKCNNNGRSYGRIKDFPQLYVGGEYRGQYEDVVRAIDDGILDDLLHAAEELQFSPQERSAIQQAELNEEMTAPLRSPQVENMPILRPTRSVNKQVRTLKDYDEDEELLLALEKEMQGKKVNLDGLF